MKIRAPDFLTGNMCCDCKHWEATAVAFVEPIDQMCISWPAAPCAYAKLSSQMGFRPGSKRRYFFMANAYPLNLTCFCANGIRNPIQRVTHDAINSLNSVRYKRVDQNICNFLRHAPQKRQSHNNKRYSSVSPHPQELDLLRSEECGNPQNTTLETTA